MGSLLIAIRLGHPTMSAQGTGTVFGEAWWSDVGMTGC